jgi:hypothetical protein
MKALKIMGVSFMLIALIAIALSVSGLGGRLFFYGFHRLQQAFRNV